MVSYRVVYNAHNNIIHPTITIKCSSSHDSSHSKALRSFAYRDQQRLLKLLVALVVGQAQLIEAGMCRGQVGKRWRCRNLKARCQLLQQKKHVSCKFHMKHRVLKSSKAHLKSPWRQLRTARGELQQPRHLRLCKVSDCRPEPAQHPPEFR